MIIPIIEYIQNQLDELEKSNVEDPFILGKIQGLTSVLAEIAKMYNTRY